MTALRSERGGPPLWSSVILRSARRSGRTLERSAAPTSAPASWWLSSSDRARLEGAEKVDGELRITKRIDDDASWLNGPPYAVEEAVFDENELLGCFRTEAELLADGVDN